MNPVKTEELVRMYTVQHLTLRQIAQLVGNISHAGVAKRLKAAGIKAKDGEHVQLKCDFCQKDIDRTRARARNQIRSFCSNDCMFAAIENPKYNPSRHGLRLSRIEVSKYFDLQPDQIVHHEDGNQANWQISNLAVFANHNEHMSFHRGGKGRPIWEGKNAVLESKG